jgi:hypothetical protein
MRIQLGILTACAAWLLTVSAQAGSLPSPDGRYTLITQPIVQVVDSSGATVLVLDNDTAGVRHIESTWSPDSKRVVVAEDYDRGSGVLAAWRQGNAWHRAVESDSDVAPFLQGFERRGLGRLTSEHRGLASEWDSDRAIGVHGELIFQGGRRVPYAYVLHFTAGGGRLSRGGYEEGAIKGADYRVTRE